MALAPTVDLEALSYDTEGFSGADLQALVYNAHLEVVHDTIAARTSSTPNGIEDAKAENSEDADPIKYTILGAGSESSKVLSRAEESALQRRVRRFLSCLRTLSSSKRPASTHPFPLFWR